VRNRKFYIRFILSMLAGLCFAVAVAATALVAWVAKEPRNLDKITPYIESALNPTDGSYRVKIGQTWLIWDGWDHPIDIRLRHVAVLTKEGQTFSSFPEIAVGVHLPSLAYGKILPTSLAITHPIISLFQNEDHSINFGFQTETADPSATAPPQTLPFALLIDQIINPTGNLRKLRFIAIRNANVTIGNNSKGVFFEATNVGFSAKRKKGVIDFFADAKIRYDDYQSAISSHFTLDRRSPTITGEAEFKGVEFNTLATLFLGSEKTLPVNMPLSGTSHVVMDTKGNIDRVAFNIDGGMGLIESDRLSAKLPISWMHAEGQVSNNANDIQIDKLSGQIDGMLLAAKGVVSLNNSDAAIRVEASLKDIPGEKVPVLWPVGLAPLSREWVTTNITGGHITEANIKTNIQFGDLAKPKLPKESIDASIALQDAAIKYLPEHPETHKVKAVIRVDGMALDAAIESASFMKDTKISNGQVLIEDLNLDNPYIKVNFDAETSTREVIKFLDLPRLKHAAHLNLKEEGAEGTVKGRAALGFYFFAPKDASGKQLESDIDYDISAEASNVSEPGFMKKFDIKNASGKFKIDKKELTFTGTGSVNGADASDASVKYLFTPENGMDTFIDVTATAPKEALPRFGYPNFDFLSGTLAVKANVKLGASTELSQAAIDLTNAAVDAKAISWKKPLKQPATLDITAQKKDGVSSIPSFHLKANDMEAKGSLGLTPDMKDISRISMEKFVLGENNLTTLNYEMIPGGFKLEAAGKSADLSGFLSKRDETKGNEFSFEQFPAVQFTASIDKLIMAGGRVVSGFKGELHCSTSICENANMHGSVGDKPFDFRILRNPKGKRQLSLHAQNAGEFLKTFDIYDKMEGGDLTITGNYDDSVTDSILRARLDINEHAIKKAPVLAKILSLASLTGFIDTLQGNGIRFTKMAIPFTLRNDVITIEKAKAYGSAIGITADGTITMPKGIIGMNGTVVPSYTINTVLGKVPLLGDVLTGGGNGKGIFAANYSVKGTYDDPDVSVNPLSILTPGFLRGLFEANDKPAKQAGERAVRR